MSELRRSSQVGVGVGPGRLCGQPVSGGGCGWRLLPAITGGDSARWWEVAAPACGVATGVRSDNAAKRRLCLIPK